MVESWYIGYICDILDNNRADYLHCDTWFRLFLENNTYSIIGIRNGNDYEVIIYKGNNISWCMNTKAPMAFRGTLKGFENWLQNNQ